MCARFYVEPMSSYHGLIKKAQQTALANEIMVKLGKSLTITGEIRPTDVVAVLAPNKAGRMAVFPMLWGFWVEGYHTPVVNCRIETADSKPLWKDSWFRRRCVIPCSLYFEWEHFSSPDGKRKKTGDKYSIQPKDSDHTYLVGLYPVLRRTAGCRCRCSPSSQGRRANL